MKKEILESNDNSLSLLLDARRAKKQGSDAIRKRQRHRLKEMIKYARANSPYYSELYKNLPEQIEDVTILPVTNKKKLMANFDDWVTDREVTLEKARQYIENPSLFGKQLLGKYLVITTSGTTGTHGIFVVDESVLTVVKPMFLRMLSEWGIRDILKIIVRGGRMAMILALNTPTATGVGVSQFARFGKRFKALSVQKPLPELVTELNKFQPALLGSYGTIAKLLAGEQEAGRLNINPVVTLLFAEGMELDEYARIAKVFKTKVANSYAASECQFMSSNCKYGWLHVNTDWVILEPVDKDYQPVAPGLQSHTVLISNLANHVQPILRYDLGDSILQRSDQCECGSPFPAIRIQGRAADTMTFLTSDGKKIIIPPLLFGTKIYDIPGIEQFQIVQAEPSKLLVRFKLTDGSDADEVWRVIHSKITQLLSDHKLSHVTVERSKELPVQSAGGKYREVIPFETVTK